MNQIKRQVLVVAVAWRGARIFVKKALRQGDVEAMQRVEEEIVAAFD
jgi:hypothetical protein